jgi:two-component system sensor histidine kinase KdpD
MAIFLPSAGDRLVVKAKTPGFEISPKVMGVAAWVWLNKQPAGRFTSTIPQARSSYFPMMTAEKIMGVMGINFEGTGQVMTPENQLVIDTIAHLGAMALDRIGSAQQLSGGKS